MSSIIKEFMFSENGRRKLNKGQSDNHNYYQREITSLGLYDIIDKLKIQ